MATGNQFVLSNKKQSFGNGDIICVWPPVDHTGKYWLKCMFNLAYYVEPATVVIFVVKQVQQCYISFTVRIQWVSGGIVQRL